MRNQMRATAVFEFLKLFTALTPAKLFQIATNLSFGHVPAKCASSGSVVACAKMTPMRQADNRCSVLIFLGFTAAFSSIFYFLIAKSGHSGGSLVNYVGSLMWCPGLAALVTCKYLGRNLSTLGWNWGKTRYQVACYLIPLAYGAASYAFVWLSGFGGFYNKPFVDLVSKDLGLGPMPPWLTISLYFLFTATISVITGLATVLGEEIGWRGFLVPELAKQHGLATTAILSGVIWAFWHYPLLLLGDYHPETIGPYRSCPAAQ
jgi:uncharacterized protein